MKNCVGFLLLLGIILLLIPPTAGFGFGTPLKGIPLGPGRLDLGATLRFRYEFLDQYNIKGYGTGKSDPVLLGRLRVSLDYRLEQGPGLFLEGQDARFWLSDDIHKGDFNPGCPYHNAVDLRQAYAWWPSICQSPLGIKIGRQTLSYGDIHILGPGNWGNAGRYAWDAAKIMWQGERYQIDVIYGKRVRFDWNEFDDTHFNYDLYTLYAQFEPTTHHHLDVFHIVKYDDRANTPGESGTDGLRVHTTGFYGKGLWGPLDYNSTAAWQCGEFGRDDISAYGLVAEIGWTLPHPLTPRLNLAFTWASGDDDPIDGNHGTFDGVLGGVAKYYGRMNLFSWMNLSDLQAGVRIKPAKGMSLCCEYHRFRLSEAKDAWYYCTGKKIRQDKTGASGTDLGEEIDLIIHYKINRHISLMAGYGRFFPGSFVRRTGSHEDADWVFTQIALQI